MAKYVVEGLMGFHVDATVREEVEADNEDDAVEIAIVRARKRLLKVAGVSEIDYLHDACSVRKEGE